MSRTSPPPTQWSLVRRAEGADGEVARAALAELCGRYWYPVYGYVRRLGHGAAASEDLTQEFFARMLAREGLAKARAERGRFRSFLYAAVRRFVRDEHAKAVAQKRGGDERPTTLDTAGAEARFEAEPATWTDPESAFVRAWAWEVHGRVLPRLRAKYEAEGKLRRFELFAPHLLADPGEVDYDGPAQELGISVGNARVVLSRLREHHVRLLREECAASVDPEDVEDEADGLVGVLRAS